MSKLVPDELVERRIHCCDDCVRRQGLQPKRPADSGVSSWFCEVCGHYGIGSTMGVRTGDWLQLIIVPGPVIRAMIPKEGENNAN